MGTSASATGVKMLQTLSCLLLLPLLPSSPSLRSPSFSTNRDHILNPSFGTFQAFFIRQCHRRLAQQQSRVSGRAVLPSWPPDGGAGEGAGGAAEGAGGAVGG